MAAATTTPRRAYVTLLARGSGSYISPHSDTNPAIPDYVASALPLLCSHQRTRSAYPLIVLAANLTAAEQSQLRLHGAAEVIDVTNYRSRSSPLSQPPSCLHPSKGGWIVWGRGDFAETMLKTAVWREFAGRYDEVAFIDADTMLIKSPDPLFEALSPFGRNNDGGAGAAPRRHSWWLGGDARCGSPKRISELAHKRACGRMAFIAAESTRERYSRSFQQNKTECHVAGWRTGFFLTRPSVALAEALEARARQGNFSLYTRTEQDVLDAEFDPYGMCHEAKKQQSQCVRAAILSDRVLSSYTVHHKIHGFRLDDKQAPPKGLTRLTILQGNKVLRNLTLTLCKDVSHELNARLGTEGFGGRGSASPRWTTEPLEGPKWFRPWMTPLREKALALLDG